jgi:hypothetical protein
MTSCICGRGRRADARGASDQTRAAAGQESDRASGQAAFNVAAPAIDLLAMKGSRKTMPRSVCGAVWQQGRFQTAMALSIPLSSGIGSPAAALVAPVIDHDGNF